MTLCGRRFSLQQMQPVNLETATERQRSWHPCTFLPIKRLRGPAFESLLRPLINDKEEIEGSKGNWHSSPLIYYSCKKSTSSKYDFFFPNTCSRKAERQIVWWRPLPGIFRVVVGLYRSGIRLCNEQISHSDQKQAVNSSRPFKSSYLMINNAILRHQALSSMPNSGNI